LQTVFVLQAGPDLPDHVSIDDDEISYADGVSVSDEPLPERFGGPARPDDPDGPPWTTLIFGLETGRYGLRDRFLTALRADAEAGRPLGRYGDALEAAFRDIFGGRGATTDASSFLAFVRQALAAEAGPAVREQLARGDRDLSAGTVDERIAHAGAAAFGFGTETGHWPADHAEVMYWMSALVPGWEVHFGQVVEESEDEEPKSFVLEAWCGGRASRSSARDQGDYVDVWSCAAFVNTLLRDVVRTDVRVHLQCEDDVARVVVGPLNVLRALRETGVLGEEDDCDDDD
jgi:hypothetical protein